MTDLRTSRPRPEPIPDCLSGAVLRDGESASANRAGSLEQAISEIPLPLDSHLADDTPEQIAEMREDAGDVLEELERMGM